MPENKEIVVRVSFSTEDDAFVALMDHPIFGDTLHAINKSPRKALKGITRALKEAEKTRGSIKSAQPLEV